MRQENNNKKDVNNKANIKWYVESYEKQYKGCELCQIKILKILLVILKKKL